MVAALAILAGACVSLVAFSQQLTLTARQGAATELRLVEASRFLESVTLWSNAELSSRLGTRRQGPWLLTVSQLDAGLFGLVLHDAADGTPLLRTATFVPGE